MDATPLLNPEENGDDSQHEPSSSEPIVVASRTPAQVNLEGGDWLLTTLLITLNAVLVSLCQFEDTKWATFLTWFAEYDCDSGWRCELVDTLFIMVVAVVNGALLIHIVNVNVRTPSKTYWKFWLYIAWLALALLNIMVILQFVDSIKMCVNGEDQVESWTAHFWLVVTAFILDVLLNIRFFYLYRFFSCFTCEEDRTLRKTPGLVQIYNREYGVHESIRQAQDRFRADATSRLNVFKAPKLQRFDTGKFLEGAANGFNHFLKRKTLIASRQGGIRFRRDSSRLPQKGVFHRFKETVFFSKLSNAKSFIGTKIMEAYHQVAEEDIFEYSSWMKSVVFFAILMLIYNCIKTTEIFFKLASSWDAYHNLALEFQDGLYSVQNSLTELDQNLTVIAEGTAEQTTITTFVNETLPSAVSDIQGIQTTLDAFEKNSGKAYDVAGTMLDIALLTTAKLVNITDLKDNAVVGAFFYMDSVIPILKYTCMVGYPIGTFIGLHSLYQVLVQHKRMSLGLEHALAARTATLYGGELKDEDAKMSLLGIEKKYKIGGAVYFFGLLMSTTVVQQHIFGFLVTFILAVVVDIKNFNVLLNIGGYLLFVYLAVLITNLLVTHIIGDRILTKDGFQIKHPWCFFLYLFTFSMVHAVLGFLYALWRALFLLITTFWVLNRLDVSLFLAGKQLDNGHHSFMSMLLLTRVIRLTNISQGYTSSDNIQSSGILPTSSSIPDPPRPASTGVQKPQKKTVAFNISDEDSSEEEKGETEVKDSPIQQTEISVEEGPSDEIVTDQVTLQVSDQEEKDPESSKV